MALIRRRLKSPTEQDTSADASARRFFGPPQLLAGEDPDAYEGLLASVRETVKPTDMVGEILVHDVVRLEWDVLRWQRLKTSLIREISYEALEEFLSDKISDIDAFVKVLTETLEEDPPNEAADLARLAQRWRADDPDADQQIYKFLIAAGLDGNAIPSARDRMIEEIVQAYARREPDALKRVNKLLASSRLLKNHFGVRPCAILIHEPSPKRMIDSRRGRCCSIVAQRQTFSEFFSGLLAAGQWMTSRPIS